MIKKKLIIISIKVWENYEYSSAGSAEMVAAQHY